MLRALCCCTAVVVGLTWSLLTADRARLWGTSERAVWADAVAKAPMKPRPWINLGREYARLGAEDLAREAYETASALSQDVRRPLTEQVYGFGFAEANLALLMWEAWDRRDAYWRMAYAHHVLSVQTDGHVPAIVQQVHTWISQQRDHASPSF